MKTQPDKRGYFGQFGGRFIAETLFPAILQVEQEFKKAIKDPSFRQELDMLFKTYVGRPTPLYFAKRLTKYAGGASIYLKREDLNHTGAHKINNTLGQALLAKRMGKRKLMAETGAGQHGVATATAAALLDMECDVYMGEEDIRRQAPNVTRMKLLGARVVPVTSGTKTLKDAMSEALRGWVPEVKTAFYVIGSVAGPHPYPLMVREFQSVIGKETRKQILQATGKLPEMIIACVGGGSNATGIFTPFIKHKNVQLVGVEAAGEGLATGKHAASLSGGEVGILHGSKSCVLQDKNGQIHNAHSISAGLDYPGVGPEHAFWKDTKRVEYCAVTDTAAVESFFLLTKLEGIIPALESAHAVSEALRRAPSMQTDENIVVNLSGRGDKDVDTITELFPNRV